MSRPAIAILAAMEAEIAPLRARAEMNRRVRFERADVAFGDLLGTPLVLARTGEGARNAAAGAAELFRRVPVSGAVVVGVSGGLSPALEAARVLVGREVLEEGRCAPGPDPGWLRHAVEAATALPATFVSSRDMLCTARAKREAYASLPTGTVASVDLESAAFARAAAEHGIPYVALRAVADTAEESLPLDFNALRDAQGAVDRRRVILEAVRQPWLVAPLWRLRQRVARCAAALDRAVQALFAGGVP